MAQLLLLILLLIPLSKLLLAVAWPDLLKRREGRRAEALLVRQFGAVRTSSRVDALGARLQAAHPLGARFGVLRGPIRNAVALPHGQILIWEGLLAATQDDDEMLAGVLAHELGHLKHEHFLSRIQWIAMARFVLGILGGAWAQRMLQSAAANVIARGFSRGQEHEADQAAVTLLRDADVDPAGMIRLLELLSADHRPGGLLGTHPDPDVRVERIRSMLGISPPEPEQAASPALPDNVLRFPAQQRS